MGNCIAKVDDIPTGLRPTITKAPPSELAEIEKEVTANPSDESFMLFYGSVVKNPA